MRYSKIFLATALLFFSSQSTFAFYPQQWVLVPKGGQHVKVQPTGHMTPLGEYAELQTANNIRLDIESINEHNNSLYYAVEYSDSTKGLMVAIIQSKGNKAGVVKSYTSIEYGRIMTDHISNPYPPRMKQTAQNFKEITPSSMIYNANKVAMERTGYNGDIKVGDINFVSYKQNLETTIRRTWNPKFYMSSNENLQAIVNFRILKNGRVINNKLIKSSGNKHFDDLATYATSTAESQRLIQTLPCNFNGNSIDVDLSIDFKKQNIKVLKITGFNGNAIIDTMNNIPDFDTYMREIQRVIKRYWNPPKGAESKQVVVLFKIARTGKLLSQEIFKSSGDVNVDNAAMQAVKYAAPFRPLPVNYNGQSIDIQFTFDYNVIMKK
ncbi:MAG: TonB C-terminal domain-containing protein [Candidatus Gastranaerophilales bacterium]|nr:TonB C-terminal domain-containing protein [Candidatus Gastranaerophilales bacterium]